MRGKSIALLCALAMVVSLTACGNYGKNDKNPGTNGNGSVVNPGGSVTAPGNGSTAGNGSVVDNNGVTQSKTGYARTNNGRDYMYDGRYTAYSDGTVGMDQYVANDVNRAGRNVETGMERFTDNTRNAIGDVGTGVRNAARDATNW